MLLFASLLVGYCSCVLIVSLPGTCFCLVACCFVVSCFYTVSLLRNTLSCCLLAAGVVVINITVCRSGKARQGKFACKLCRENTKRFPRVCQCHRTRNTRDSCRHRKRQRTPTPGQQRTTTRHTTPRRRHRRRSPGQRSWWPGHGWFTVRLPYTIRWLRFISSAASSGSSLVSSS